MSIASEITRLQGVKADILTAIADKGVTVPAGSALDDCPDLIASISGGGGGGVPYLKNIMPTTGVKVVDENGYIGGDFPGQGTNYYNNFAVLIPGADYSTSGLGTVTFGDTPVTIGGRVYRTATIGSATWLAENLDYKFSGCGIGGSDTPSTPNAWYYNNDETNYGIDGTYKCGLLYNWYAVKYLEDNKATLLPDGWHVPTRTEWETLATEVGGSNVAGTKLKSVNGVIGGSWPSSWNGTDDYRFCALPAGSYYNTFNIGTTTGFWQNTEDGTSFAYNSTITTGNSLNTSSYSKKRGYSVRLVKDS